MAIVMEKMQNIRKVVNNIIRNAVASKKMVSKKEMKK